MRQKCARTSASPSTGRDPALRGEGQRRDQAAQLSARTRAALGYLSFTQFADDNARQAVKSAAWSCPHYQGPTPGSWLCLWNPVPVASHIAVVPSRCAHGQATEVAKRCELIAGNDLQARYDIIRWYISNGRLAYVELRAAASAGQCGQPPTARAPMNAGPWGPDRLVDEEAKRR